MGTFQSIQRESEPKSQTLIQPALEIGKEDDEHEKEANHVADKVMKMSDPEEEKKKMSAGSDKVQMMSEGPIRRKMEEDGKVSMMSEGPVAIQKMSDGTSGMEAPQHVEQGIMSSKGNGQSLSESTQQELGSKMNADLSNVNIHTDNNAVEMNREIGAKAFTHGNDIYFNQGQYNPSSSTGKHLLAHELTHTVQQGKGVKRKIQRAESDTRIKSSTLQDSASDINTHVNQVLALARKNNPGNTAGMIGTIYDYLGMSVTPARSQIEYWIDKFGSTKKYLPDKSETKYAGTMYSMWIEAAMPGGFAIINPTIKANGILIGSDKLGHFFQQGKEYYDYVTTDKKTAAEAEKDIGYEGEAGGYGLDTTGVFSNADLVANKKGMNFYNDFAKNNAMTFDLSNYIDNQWNEQSNPNFYTQSLAETVWNNLINKATKARMIDVKNPGTEWLNSTPALEADDEELTGTISYKDPKNVLTTLTLTEGVITYKKDITSLEAVTGIKITVNWSAAGKTGQIFLESQKENLLYGSVYEGTGKSKLLGGINIFL